MECCTSAGHRIADHCAAQLDGLIIVLRAEFTSYRQRIAELSHLIPEIAPQTTSFTQAERDMLSSYCILFLASSESLFEEMCKYVATKSKDKYLNYSNLNRSAKHMMLLRYVKSDDLAQLEIPFSSYDSRINILDNYVRLNKVEIELKLNRAFDSYIEKIKSNHGLSKKNLQSLLAPIGFPIGEVPPDLESALPGLISWRGEAAHTSGASVQRIIHPTRLPGEVAKVLRGFAELREKLMKHIGRR